MFDHQVFSRSLKVSLSDYLEGRFLSLSRLEDQVRLLDDFDPDSLRNDAEKKAFWINIYNELTNYFIIRLQLKKSVWEVPDFFNVLTVSVGKYCLSLDDIEHGILRRNGVRNRNKPRQFSSRDSRRNLMINQLDPRIHFALNCGSISCPPIAFYTASDIDAELALAEENFARQEFLIDHEKGEILCSEIFIWYRSDFPESYLNLPSLAGYVVVLILYRWTFN
jgi:hypothetical protein